MGRQGRVCARAGCAEWGRGRRARPAGATCVAAGVEASGGVRARHGAVDAGQVALSPTGPGPAIQRTDDRVG
jgi:hypothetical protein